LSEQENWTRRHVSLFVYISFAIFRREKMKGILLENQKIGRIWKWQSLDELVKSKTLYRIVYDPNFRFLKNLGHTLILTKNTVFAYNHRILYSCMAYNNKHAFSKWMDDQSWRSKLLFLKVLEKMDDKGQKWTTNS